MTANIYSRPIIPLVLSMISGIALGSWFPGFKIWAYVGAVVIACLIFFAIKENKSSVFLPLILFVGLGYLSIQSWVAPEFPANHVIHYMDTHPWQIAGVIDDNPLVTGNRQKLILRTETLTKNSKHFAVIGKIRVTVSGKGPMLSMGDRITFYSRLRSIKNFNNPGMFNYKRYMAFQKIWGTAYVAAKKLISHEKNKHNGPDRFINDIRKKISDLVDQTGSEESRIILKALIIGHRNSLTPELRAAFNRSGVGHLLAISGLHIGIVATVAFTFFLWILSYIKPLLWHARVKKTAVALSIGPVFVYGLLAGMSPSTQRAIIMVTVFLLSFLFEREQDLMNTLALAAMLILAVDSPALFSISFQLSFTAALAIIYGLSRVRNYWKSDPKSIKNTKLFKIKQKLFYFLAASFFAIVGTLPIGMLYFNQISLVGFLANVIIVPLIGSLVVPLGLFAVFLYPLSISGAIWMFKAGAAVLSQALAIVKFFAGLPYAAVKTVTPNWFEICLLYLLLWSLINIRTIHPAMQGKQKTLNTVCDLQKESSKTAWICSIPRHKIARIIILLVILVGMGDIFFWCNRRFWHNDLRVTIIDVRHGSSALLELPGGYNMLIDGGGFSDNTIFDIGARVVAPLLWRKKIKTIDTIVLSHPNSDHLNGLIYVAGHFNVKDVWTNNQPTNTMGYQNFMAVVAQKNICHTVFEKLSRTCEINGVRVNILYPPYDFIAKCKQERWRDLNNNSMVIKATFGAISFLFPGDIKARAEAELIAQAGNLLESSILLAPHHGSNTSSTGLFVEKVNPKAVIISSGWHSRFGLPDKQVLKRYKERGVRIFETARDGAVTASTDGRSLTIKSVLNPNGP